jgi:hypothetical protein
MYVNQTHREIHAHAYCASLNPSNASSPRSGPCCSPRKPVLLRWRIIESQCKKGAVLTANTRNNKDTYIHKSEITLCLRLHTRIGLRLLRRRRSVNTEFKGSASSQKALPGTSYVRERKGGWEKSVWCEEEGQQEERQEVGVNSSGALVLVRMQYFVLMLWLNRFMLWLNRFMCLLKQLTKQK